MVESASEIVAAQGSGNVFADLGLAEPEEFLLKEDLAHWIGAIAREHGLTQAALAGLLGIDQP